MSERIAVAANESLCRTLANIALSPSSLYESVSPKIHIRKGKKEKWIEKFDLI